MNTYLITSMLVFLVLGAWCVATCICERDKMMMVNAFGLLAMFAWAAGLLARH